jgi:pantoate--beta-alanine ligase
MHIFKKKTDLDQFLQSLHSQNKRIGFVPTMGALHEGHLSLIRASKSESDYTVCSIFVNPTQFNDPNDLEKYPRTMSSDIELLLKSNCDILFSPSVNEIYDEKDTFIPSVNLGIAGHVMEALQRPGHFEGVMQVVYKLLNIVKPKYLYMGLKDYQQQLIVGKMISQYQIPTELRSMPTGREPSGLARSSRNARLSPSALSSASILYETLEQAAQQLPTENVRPIIEKALEQIVVSGLKPEYFELADAYSLEPLSRVTSNDQVVICVAAWIEGVRLIDNFLWQPK